MRDHQYMIRCVLSSCAIVPHLFLSLKCPLTTSVVIKCWIPCVLLMLQTTQIELKPKDCISLIKSLGIQFTPQLFSTMSIPKKVRYNSAPNSHKFKPPQDEIQSQQHKS